PVLPDRDQARHPCTDRQPHRLRLIAATCSERALLSDLSVHHPTGASAALNAELAGQLPVPARSQPARPEPGRPAGFGPAPNPAPYPAAGDRSARTAPASFPNGHGAPSHPAAAASET